jgi:heat shock protein HslJ
MESIVNKTWTMTSMNGERIDSTIYMNGAPSISFSNDGKLNGSTGCNSFSGSYKYEAGKLTLDPGAMTRMYCPGSNEEEYIEALNSVNYFKLKNDVLILLTNQEKEVMEFESSNK